jgi:alkylhydroperoxidase/carboxymuconolactone decarboxylase family protein YurZ
LLKLVVDAGVPALVFFALVVVGMELTAGDFRRVARQPRTVLAATAGQWNEAWDPFFELDPAWTEAFIAAGAPVYIGNVSSPRLAELLSIAFDASITHLYAPGTRRHIKAALKHGATMEEIMKVLKICVAEGVHVCNLAVPILAEELSNGR